MRIPGLNRLKRTIKQTQLNQLAPKMDMQVEEAFSLFSDPRGGSTWLTELLLAELKGVEVIWEPLNITEVEGFQKLDFSWRQYIPHDQEWTAAKSVFEKVFKGQILNNWTTYMTTPKALKTAEGLFVKFCRGNALLPWLVNQFDFKYQPIYMIRHPFAVVASQLKQGGWNYDYGGFQIPEGPFSEHTAKHKGFLESLASKEEALTATWCLTNQVPLTHPNNNQSWITLSYEEMVLEPLVCLKRIFDRWEMSANIDFKHLEQKVNKPSSTTVKGSAISGNTQIEQWTKRLSEEQVQKMSRVLEYFDVEVYSKDPYPQIKFNQEKG